MNPTLSAIYQPCLKFFCSYRHAGEVSGQIKGAGEQHKPALQRGNETSSWNCFAGKRLPRSPRPLHWSRSTYSRSDKNTNTAPSANLPSLAHLFGVPFLLLTVHKSPEKLCTLWVQAIFLAITCCFLSLFLLPEWKIPLQFLAELICLNLWC